MIEVPATKQQADELLRRLAAIKVAQSSAQDALALLTAGKVPVGAVYVGVDARTHAILLDVPASPLSD